MFPCAFSSTDAPSIVPLLRIPVPLTPEPFARTNILSLPIPLSSFRSTSSPAARPTVPFRAVIVPPAAFVTVRPIKNTSPPIALIRPMLVISPLPPLKTMSPPARNSPLLTSSVESANPCTSIVPLAPTNIPFGLITNTFPLAFSAP